MPKKWDNVNTMTPRRHGWFLCDGLYLTGFTSLFHESLGDLPTGTLLRMELKWPI